MQKVLTALAVAVVVCTYDDRRWKDVLAAMASLARQTLRPSRLVLVVDHNDGLLGRLTREFPSAEVMPNDGPPGLSGARNTGLAAAREEIVAFLDDDAVAAPDWLERMVAAYEDDGVLGVGGGTDPAWECSRPRWLPEEFHWVVSASYRGQPTRRTAVRNVFGGNMSLRREAALAAGGFNCGMGKVADRPFGCEETELCIAIQQQQPDGRILFEPEARIAHLVPRYRCSPRYFVLRCWCEGRSKAALTRHVGSGHGLQTERRYVARVLPAGIARHVGDVFRARDPFGLSRAAAIAVGLGATGAGFLYGRAARFGRRAT